MFSFQQEFVAFDSPSTLLELRVCAWGKSMTEGYEHVLGAGHPKETSFASCLVGDFYIVVCMKIGYEVQGTSPLFAYLNALHKDEDGYRTHSVKTGTSLGRRM